MLLEIAGGMLFAPFITLLVVILLLASFGKSFGIRRAYVQLLLRLFEVSIISWSVRKYPALRSNCVIKKKPKSRFINSATMKMRRHWIFKIKTSRCCAIVNEQRHGRVLSSSLSVRNVIARISLSRIKCFENFVSIARKATTKFPTLQKKSKKNAVAVSQFVSTADGSKDHRPLKFM